jgi:hypothetical protein
MFLKHFAVRRVGFLCFLECWTMDKVQKPTNSEGFILLFRNYFSVWPDIGKLNSQIWLSI